jgi:hypothetical protein
MFIHSRWLTKLLSIVIPVGAITLWPFIFTSNPIDKLSEATKNHELIHLAQQQEMLLLMLSVLIIAALVGLPIWPFTILLFSSYYIVYGFFFLINFILSKEKDRGADAYFKIPLEIESYDNQYDLDYLSKRKPFAWIKYIKYIKK